ncbi:MAG: hypothetical protein AAGJ93_01965, partial [Bacteroidota bacterium]
MFKEGDYVKVKANTKLETGELIDDWVGEVVEVYENEQTALLVLDSQTLDSLNDTYLESCIEEGAEPFEYVFEFDELELTNRRDTDEEQKKALDKLVDRMILLEDYDGEQKQYSEQTNRWIKEFAQSDQHQTLNASEKDDVSFILDTFMDYAYNYFLVLPDEWTPAIVKEICLDIVPRKISSEASVFENYGSVLN